MPRNLDRRVEAMLRVTDPRMRARLDEILAINFADDVLAWTLERDGTWRKVETVDGHRVAGAVPGARGRARQSPHARRLTPWRRRELTRVRRRAAGDRDSRTSAWSRTSRDAPDGDDPESVHQARVATRRLRSDLRTFEPFLDERFAAELRGELRWLGAELGAVATSR